MLTTGPLLGITLIVKLYVQIVAVHGRVKPDTFHCTSGIELEEVAARGTDIEKADVANAATRRRLLNIFALVVLFCVGGGGFSY